MLTLVKEDYGIHSSCILLRLRRFADFSCEGKAMPGVTVRKI